MQAVDKGLCKELDKESLKMSLLLFKTIVFLLVLAEWHHLSSLGRFSVDRNYNTAIGNVDSTDKNR